MSGWSVVVIAIAYIATLFVVASYADDKGYTGRQQSGRPLIYAMSLAIFCTSWTFYGSVGLAAARGYEFLAVYIGPIIAIFFGKRLISRIIHLSKDERITSIADFLGARYGKSQVVAAIATLILVVGSIPYIALQLKAVSRSFLVFVGPIQVPYSVPLFADSALIVAFAMALFAILFGTRQVDTSEHQKGIISAVALESIIKLVAFLMVGSFVVFFFFEGPREMIAIGEASGAIEPFQHGPDGVRFLTIMLISTFAIFLLPRQFHVMVVENHSELELSRARYIFPLYLVAINLFVIPIAIAGDILLDNPVDADLYVLQIPRVIGSDLMAIIGFIGGLSAATAMVIVACVALSIMVSNDLVVPLLLRRPQNPDAGPADIGRRIILVRRMVIVIIMLAGYFYYRTAGATPALASMGLLSFAAVAQLAPAFFGGLIWKQATARGAVAGLLSGIAVWFYTLLMPNFLPGDPAFHPLMTEGPFGLSILRPQQLFFLSLDPLTHGVLWSLVVNVTVYVLVSLTRAPEAIERLQANVFVPAELKPAPALRLWRTSVRIGDLKATVARYLGQERTERSFQSYAAQRAIDLSERREADVQLLRFAEQLLASAIGAASSRLVLSLLLKRHEASSKAAVRLLDDATAAIQFNRDLLQTALDEMRQGISVFDKDHRLICWNRQFRELLDLPMELGQVGTSIHTIVRYNAERGAFGEGSPSRLVAERIEKLLVTHATFEDKMATSGITLEVRTSPMPGGGLVTTYTDVTERRAHQEALAKANESLERRVAERTEELLRLNQELARAKAKADEANLGKTRFLAGAGHDIAQPLNAARLYISTLMEAVEEPEHQRLAGNVETALTSVEEIIGALLDISRLDAGAMKPEVQPVRLDDILQPLATEFAALAAEKGLELKVMQTGLTVRTDRRLFRRLVQNLISNAIKYTPKGCVLVGARRRDGTVRVDVFDTGVGIPSRDQRLIFREFQRLEEGAKVARGLGLGLSIVERIARVLSHPIVLQSTPGKGSRFSVSLPRAADLPAEPAAPPRPVARPQELAGLIVGCIDNEPDILDGMVMLLSRWGCEVQTGASEAELERKFVQSGLTPDIVIVDYHLDENTTGIEAARKLRWRFGKDLPAVLLTADRSAELREEAEKKDIALLNKPLRPAALRALIARVARGTKTAAE
ncbi:MAG: hybrid sensor histidine kinase/response regulator [Hyphomicrobiaceae bacterium]|nr:hybrid sensor histidine kinase/response regulator [Hyphomicrobiaceae bacterium]